jgi:hypothetical protein
MNPKTHRTFHTGFTGNRFVLAALVCAFFVGETRSSDRFGFEYNEAEPWTDAKHDLLLARLASIGAGCDINVNALAGGWQGMQPGPDRKIDFTVTDRIVGLFGKYRFSLTWNLFPNAAWAFPHKPACRPDTVLGVPLYAKHCAPEPGFESQWSGYVKAVVERYDGDGLDDMPGLRVPVLFYVMTGEIRFGKTGNGDGEQGPFWYDSIEALLRLHRITLEAIREADPDGSTRLVSSGGVLFDLFADFPDYPAFEPVPGSALDHRLEGANFRASRYKAGWDSLAKMLDGFGNDSGGVECDFVGWHPHFSWRVTDQEFAWIRAHAGGKPIYIDDMWTNLFPVGYAAVPGEAQFTANRPPNRDWVMSLHGDFPNVLFASNDPYGELFAKLNASDPAVLAWYHARGSMQLVKSAVAAFGEGAEHVSFSGTNDMKLLGLFRGWELGWLNLLGTQDEGYAVKPQFLACGQVIEKLSDFTEVRRVSAGADPRTRVYRFDRPRGPVWVCWSETGGPPPALDYGVCTGEAVRIATGADRLKRTFVITDTSGRAADSAADTLDTDDGSIAMILGYAPFFLEPVEAANAVRHAPDSAPTRFALEQNHPNPFNSSTVIRFLVKDPCRVRLKVFDATGREIAILTDGPFPSGSHDIRFRADGYSSGVYFYRIEIGGYKETKKMVLLD